MPVARGCWLLLTRAEHTKHPEVIRRVLNGAHLFATARGYVLRMLCSSIIDLAMLVRPS